MKTTMTISVMRMIVTQPLNVGNLDMLLYNHLEAHLYTSGGTGNGERGKAI